jgi:hypothetical protein
MPISGAVERVSVALPIPGGRNPLARLTSMAENVMAHQPI